LDRAALIKRLEAMLDEAARAEMWGTIELELRAGSLQVIRTSKTEKVQTENTRGPRFR
jgi:hypothetical protein